MYLTLNLTTSIQFTSKIQTEQEVHTSVSVTKQYNLVLVKGRWCCEAGKVTMWLKWNVTATYQWLSLWSVSDVGCHCLKTRLDTKLFYQLNYWQVATTENLWPHF